MLARGEMTMTLSCLCEDVGDVSEESSQMYDTWAQDAEIKVSKAHE